MSVARNKIGVMEIDAKRESTWRKLCSNCHKWKPFTRFFTSYNKLNSDTRRHHICIECMTDIIEQGKTYKEKLENFKQLCEDVDIYCDEKVFEQMLKRNVDEKNTVRKSIGEYFRNINLNYSEKRFSDSPCFGQVDKKALTYDKVEQHLIEKWGENFKPYEYGMLEKAYDELAADKMMKYSSSKQYLKLAAMLYVRAQTAIQENNPQEAEKYMKQYNDVMKNGEFMPSLLAKNSTAESLGSFAELAKMVEEVDDFVSLLQILPEYVLEPHDEVDKLLWYYIQSVQKTQNMPLSDYADIYKFFEQLEERSEKLYGDKDEG